MKKQTKDYRIAEVDFQISYRYPYMEKLCRDYECKDPSAQAISIDVDEKDLAYERTKSEEVFPEYSYESLAIYRKICEEMLTYDSFLFHCSAVSVDGKAYIFAAPSGTGKSTHTRLWREHFGERAIMINDDKPLFQVREDAIYVCGTPWCGKHGIQTNTKAPIHGICILRRGEKNEIKKISAIEAYPDLYRQTYRPEDQAKMRKTLALLKQLAERIPMYELHCNISEEAAVVAWNGMKDA